MINPQRIITISIEENGFMKKQGKILKEFSINKAPAFTCQVPYHRQGLIVQSGKYLCGVVDLTEAEKGRALIKEMLVTIQQRSQNPHAS